MRLNAFHEYYGIRRYAALDEILNDSSVEMILNLTNPRSHFELTRACLLAGKHVYSEKPLAISSVQAAELVELAKQQGLRVATAPCSMLGETCQTMWRALKDRMIGPVRLVYASFDDGMVHRMNPTRWRSASGAPWPAKDEFETGCTYEHAAYVLSWLAAFLDRRSVSLLTPRAEFATRVFQLTRWRATSRSDVLSITTMLSHVSLLVLLRRSTNP